MMDEFEPRVTSGDGRFPEGIPPLAVQLLTLPDDETLNVEAITISGDGDFAQSIVRVSRSKKVTASEPKPQIIEGHELTVADIERADEWLGSRISNLNPIERDEPISRRRRLEHLEETARYVGLSILANDLILEAGKLSREETS